MTTVVTDKARVTVDLPAADYAALRMAAAEEGRGATMSGIIRRLVSLYLDAVRAEDEADLAFIRTRLESSAGATMTTAELDAKLADLW